MAKTWAHTTCCELHHCGSARGCCGCCDQGCCFVVQHAMCLPCSFGATAEQGADSSCACCCIGLVAGTFVGMHFCGGPVLPCVVRTRRKLVLKYGLEESFCSSLLHVMCCPLASMLQMLQEVQDRERVEIGCCGKVQHTDYSRMPTVQHMH